jgi:ABC-2 type transport system ATP-binding protein
VTRVSLTDHHGEVVRLEVLAEGGADLREELARRVINNGWALRHLDLRRSSLEERFIRAVQEATLATDVKAESENESEIEAA